MSDGATSALVAAGWGTSAEAPHLSSRIVRQLKINFDTPPAMRDARARPMSSGRALNLVVRRRWSCSGRPISVGGGTLGTTAAGQLTALRHQPELSQLAPSGRTVLRTVLTVCGLSYVRVDLYFGIAREVIDARILGK